jgi:hypothetical protein
MLPLLVSLTMNSSPLVLTKVVALKRHVLGLKQMSREGVSIKLLIGEISIGDRLIPGDAKVVAQLVLSIQQIRQTTPILVRLKSDGSHALIDGFNRIEALKQLGETEILASVVDVTSEEEAKACEAISNNHRRQKLSALDRALTDVAYLRYVEGRVPRDAAPRGGRQPKEKFQGKTARELGVSPDQIARSCKIAKIVPYVQNAIRRRKLEDNQALLLQVAASGDDVSSQVLTLGRLRPEPGKLEADHPTESAPVDRFEGPASSRGSSQLGSSESSVKDFEVTAGNTRSPAASTEEQVPGNSASTPSGDQPSPDEPIASTFGAIKKEWEAATTLRRILRASVEQDRKRFFNECFIPEVFPALLEVKGP